MKFLTNGEPSTLGTYLKIAMAFGGKDCKAVQFFEQKIAEQGADEEVIADETQVLILINKLNEKCENRG